jgi:hypothetical protein
MTAKVHWIAAALAGALICAPAGAQVRNGTASPAASSTGLRAAKRVKASQRNLAMSSGHVSAATSSIQQAGAIQIPPSGLVSSEFFPAPNLFAADSTLGVPGLGFDFPHLAAVGTGNRPSHFFLNGQHGQGPTTAVLFWGYPYYASNTDDSAGDSPDQQAAQQGQPQPQVNVIQQQAPPQQDADSGSDTGNASGVAAESDAQAIPDVSNFILVRRDGRILFASLFSVVGTELQYVTPEGIRRSMQMADLDAGATQQMNEARGTTVQFHN